MKIQEIATPAQPQTHGAKVDVTGGHMSARDRAMAKLLSTQNAAPSHPVPNPTNISPEEMRAVVSSKPVESRSEGQNYKDESTVVESSEPKAETKAAEEPLSSQYAILARKEKMLRQREQQLRTREAELKAKDAPIAPPTPSFDESKYVNKDRLTQDPFTVLTELGLTYDQLTEMALNGPKPQEIALMNQIKSLESKIAEIEGKTQKSFEDREVQQRQQVVAQLTNDTKRLVSSDPNFEMIQAERAEKEVVKLIEKTFDEDGILLSVEEAAQQVEDYLVERALRIAKAKKIQQKLAPAPAVPEKSMTEDSKQPQLKTLTNSVASSRKLTARERALLAFEGKLSR